MSKYFNSNDAFEHIQPSTFRCATVAREDEIKIPMRDRRSGAEYMVTERLPNGPQGDFRIKADFRNRTIVGTSRPLDDAFESDRMKPEPMVSEMEIENLVRQRETLDTRRSMAVRPTNEPMSLNENGGNWTDHGSFIEDPFGKIRDKPSNVVGMFGTEAERPKAMPIKQENAAKSFGGRYEQPISKPSARFLDPLEKKISTEQKMQVLLTNAFRGLTSNQIVSGPKSEVNDRKLGTETPIVARAIVDSGLLGPWEPPKIHGSSDKPSRPDDIAHSVGTRALQSLMKGPLAPEIQDLPKAEREIISLAIGRTILNALTLGPEQKGSRPNLEDRPQYEELKKSISLTISPSILAGLVAPEMLSDRSKKDLMAVARTSAPAQKAMGVPNRHTVSLKQGSETVAPRRATLGQFETNKKKMFFTEYEISDTVNTQRRELRPEISAIVKKPTEQIESSRSMHGTFSIRSEIVPNETTNFLL